MKKNIQEGIETLIGCFIIAIGTSLFLIPNKLSTGGFSGLATILYYLFDFKVGVVIVILNIPLFIIAFFRLGKKFLIKTILATVLLSFFIDLLEGLPIVTSDRFLACIYGGIIVGIGSAINLKANASTGGSDLFTYIIRTYSIKYRSSILIIIVDYFIVILNMIFLGAIDIGMYSAIAIYLMGKMIDIFFEGVYFTKVLFIISERHEEIADTVGKIVNRGSTGLYSKGMYTR